MPKVEHVEKPNYIALGATVTPDLKERLQRLAKEKDMPFAWIIRRALSQFADKNSTTK